MVNSSSSVGQKILIVSDAWQQTNGVVTTLTNVISHLEKSGHTVKVLSHTDCEHTCQLPLYPEITLGWISKKQLVKWCLWADSIHITTPEGPVGLRTLLYCTRNRLRFTTGYHTQWPEFIRARLPVPKKLVYGFMKWIHQHSSGVLVPTDSMKAVLASQGFRNLRVWTRGVDRSVFSSAHRKSDHQKPVLLCVSRISNEKGLDDFCALDTSRLGTDIIKVLVGDGPYLPTLKKRYPDVIYTGELKGTALASQYANADVFVFPSKADTFGVVILEAISSGTPVAAYPVTGPVDIIESGTNGYLAHDLCEATMQCFTLDRARVEQSSESWTWETVAEQFEGYLVAKSLRM